MIKRPQWQVEFIGVGAVLVLGVAVRAAHLQHPALSIDEAESAVNALTILQHGYPADQYLGLPIYENTMTRPWPQHAEYEFRDSSYSDRGMAVYHGWLPLYLIAGSFKLAGIRPDDPAAAPRVQHAPEEMHRRTAAARAPSVAMGAIFLVAVFAAARSMYGRDAAWVALILAALAEPAVRVARTARYYSATLVLSTLCCFGIWMMCTRGRWSDYLAGAIAFALLFHTHALTFVIACIVWSALAFWMLRRPGAWPKVAAFGGIVGAAVVPWMLLSGFWERMGDMPAARSLLKFPDDYLAYLVEHWKFTVAVTAGVVWLCLILALRRRLPPRVAGPFVAAGPTLWLLLGWMVAGYVVFMLLVPAPSCFLWRLTLGLQGPGILFVAILLAGASRVVLRRPSAWVAVPVVAVLAFPTNLRAWFASPPQVQHPVYAAVEYLRGLTLRPDTRIYATPNQHLPLVYYSGLPVQSIVPIRRSFLESYEGEILILDCISRFFGPHWTVIHEAAAEAGISIAEDESRAWERRLATYVLREKLAGEVASVEPPVVSVPAYLERVLDKQRQRLRDGAPRDGDGRWQNPAVFRGYEYWNKWDLSGFWQTFFYRFVGPASRSGPNVNYAGRVRRARVAVLPSTWLVYHCPPITGLADRQQNIRAD